MYLDTQLDTKFEIYQRYQCRYTKCIYCRYKVSIDNGQPARFLSLLFICYFNLCLDFLFHKILSPTELSCSYYHTYKYNMVLN